MAKAIERSLQDAHGAGALTAAGDMERIAIEAIVGGVVAVLESLASAGPGDGLYFFPGMDLGGNPSPEQQAAWEARCQCGATGMSLYPPAPPMRPVA